MGKKEKHYENKMKLEVLNTPENEEFVKKAVIAFVSERAITEHDKEVVGKMVEEVIEDFKDEGGKKEKWLVIKAEINDCDFSVEADKRK